MRDNSLEVPCRVCAGQGFDEAWDSPREDAHLMRRRCTRCDGFGVLPLDDLSAGECLDALLEPTADARVTMAVQRRLSKLLAADRPKLVHVIPEPQAQEGAA